MRLLTITEGFVISMMAHSQIALPVHESTKLEPEPPECNLYDRQLVKEIPLPGHSLSYFVSTDSNSVFFISGGQNHALNLISGAIKLIPGNIDPVPSPDGKLLTVSYFTDPDFHPVAKQQSPKTKMVNNEINYPDTEMAATPNDPSAAESADAHQGLAIFANNSSINSESKPLLFDAQATGNYQSVGILKDTGKVNKLLRKVFGLEKTVYRIITDDALNDYAMDSEGRLTRVYDSPIKLCKKIYNSKTQDWDEGAFDGTLPMLSKDGRHLSVYSKQATSTLIFRIDESDPSKCTLELSLGYPTGKVDFNSDNSRIAFHVDNYGMQTSGFENVAAGHSKDILVMNLERSDDRINKIKSFIRLTAQTQSGNGTYYPRFAAKDSLVAIRQKGDNFSLASFDLKQSPESVYWTPQSALPANKSVHAEYMLGGLWDQYCNNGKGLRIPTPTQARFFVKNLDPKLCAEMVATQFAKYQQGLVERISKVKGLRTDVLANLTLEDLQSACPDQKITGVLMASGTLSDPGHKSLVEHLKLARQLVAKNCMGCHGNPSYPALKALSIDQLSKSPELIDKILLKVETGQMPPGGTGMTPEERIAFSREFYLLSEVSHFR